MPTGRSRSQPVGEGASPAPVPRVAPGPRYATFLGFRSEWRRDPVALLERLRGQYGRIFSLRMPPLQGYVIADPEAVKHILHDNDRNYHKGRAFGRVSRYIGRGMIFNTESGDLLTAQRQVLTPGFQRRNLARMADTMVSCTQELAKRWRQRADAIDVAWEMSRLTTEIVCRTLLDRPLAERADAVTRAVASSVELFAEAATDLFPRSLLLPTRRSLRYRTALRTVYAFVDDVIESRERTSTTPGAMIDDLLAASRDPVGPRLDLQQVRDECVMLLGAGSETTAAALAWTWLFLAENPAVARQVVDELGQVLGGRPPRFEDLDHLSYLQRVILESLRLRPPVWCQTRDAYGEDRVGGFRIPAGTACLISTYLVHHDPQLWPDPEVFDPDRFLPENRAGARYTFFPFGVGNRRCLGERFALMEIQLVLATLVQEFELHSPSPVRAVEMDASFTLRPRGGLRMRVHARSQSEPAAPRGSDAPRDPGTDH